MQTRAELYDFLDYHRYEQKLDELFAEPGVTTSKQTGDDMNDPDPPEGEEIRRASAAPPPATPRCARSAAAATTCITAATTSTTWRRKSTFEEVAHLLVHGALPTARSSTPTRPSSSACAACRRSSPRRWSWCRPTRIRWTCCAPVARCLARCCPSATAIRPPRRATSPTSLMASFGSMLLYWWHFTRNGRRIDVETDDDNDRRALPAPAARRAAERAARRLTRPVAGPLRRA